MNPNRCSHPFERGDYVKSKIKGGMGQKGIGKVVDYDESHITVDWVEWPQNSLYHWMNLERTNERPESAVDKVVKQLEAEYIQLEADRDEIDRKLANLTVAITAVKAVKL